MDKMNTITTDRKRGLALFYPGYAKKANNIFSMPQLLMPLLLVIFFIAMNTASAAVVSDIRNTKHNLSVTSPGTTKANSETQVCVFCHTPHGATSGQSPLWNRTVSGTYTRYTSSSLDANVIADGFKSQPAGSSLLCLSCHDGQVALGSVNVLNGATDASISVNGSTTTKIPSGAYGSNTGFTRHIGDNLTNDHPISITYNDDLVTADGEMRELDTNQKDVQTGGDIIGVRSTGYRPDLPLEPTSTGGQGQVQCATCHDPHLFDPTDPNRKFLRMNRLQKNASPTNDNFNASNDIICLACHKKDFASWGQSAHAQSSVGDEVYEDAAAAIRQFPTGTTVWQAGCLNCHDTHTVQGSRRLLREGVDTGTGGTGSGAYRLGVSSGTSPAIENTCYQCHSNTASGKVVKTGNGSVPDIKTEFSRTYRMPITTADQPAATELHDIKDGDMIEEAANLGLSDTSKRHAECSDCHNPHRVRRSSTFTGGDTNARTHVAGGPQGNIASGVLRGIWGVEPVFDDTDYAAWPSPPISFAVKKGDPGNAALPTSRSDSQSATHLTREYQLCFKCHSNYSNSTDPANYPSIPTANRANGLTRYTNVAAEFGSVRATDPATSGGDQGEFHGGTSNNKGTACGGGDCEPGAGLTVGGGANHRSWHPVVFPTGRDRAERGMGASGSINLRPPFVDNIGKQTMHCSDCHGQSTAWTDGTGPNGNVQGPHGSSDKFLLRGTWTSTTSLSNVSSSLCGNCHQPGVSGTGSGYGGDHLPDAKMSFDCMNCHVALPHGWKNKAFLVNLKCVGSEVTGLTGGECQAKGNYSRDFTGYNAEPYYYQAYLNISTWQRSGTWTKAACGGTSMESCRD